jgi:hypothetical protein
MISHKLIVVKSVVKKKGDESFQKICRFGLNIGSNPGSLTPKPCVLPIDAHRGGGAGVRSEKLSHNNAIKHERGDPLDFLTTHSTPPKNNFAKTPRPPWIST